MIVVSFLIIIMVVSKAWRTKEEKEFDTHVQTMRAQERRHREWMNKQEEAQAELNTRLLRARVEAEERVSGE